MKRYFWRVSCLWILVAMPLAASTTRIWALNIGSDGTNSIDIIDPVTNKIVQTIEGIPKPHDVAFSPDKSRAYVTSEDEQSENALYVVDTKTGRFFKRRPWTAGGATFRRLPRTGNGFWSVSVHRETKKGLFLLRVPPALWMSWTQPL